MCSSTWKQSDSDCQPFVSSKKAMRRSDQRPLEMLTSTYPPYLPTPQLDWKYRYTFVLRIPGQYFPHLPGFGATFPFPCRGSTPKFPASTTAGPTCVCTICAANPVREIFGTYQRPPIQFTQSANSPSCRPAMVQRLQGRPRRSLTCQRRIPTLPISNHLNE